MKRLRTVLAAVAMTVSMFGMTATTSGNTIESCSEGKWTAYENVDGGGDWLVGCYPTNVPNLFNIAHSGSGFCGAIAGDAHDDWNDCISSLILNDSSHHICFYTGANYSGSKLHIGTAGHLISYWWPETFADSITSIRWEPGISC